VASSAREEAFELRLGEGDVDGGGEGGDGREGVERRVVVVGVAGDSIGVFDVAAGEAVRGLDDDLGHAGPIVARIVDHHELAVRPGP
jgi:hypothetical protein